MAVLKKTSPKKSASKKPKASDLQTIVLKVEGFTPLIYRNWKSMTWHPKRKAYFWCIKN